MQITLILLVFSFVVSFVVYLRRKDIYKAFTIFSILANVSFLVNIESKMFVVYHIRLLSSFSLFIWPLLNLFLLVWIFKYKKENK
jgi:hypothetical protein